MGTSRRITAAAGGIAAAMLVVALAGCSAISGSSPGSTFDSTRAASHGASSRPSDSATGRPSTATPTLVAGGSATQNKAFFDHVNSTLFAANASAHGRAIIDNLVAAGFNKATMQVTPDKTSINGTVDSILFSVRLGDECLLGQRGGDGYSSAVQATLKDGGCLIGKTRPITW